MTRFTSEDIRKIIQHPTFRQACTVTGPLLLTIGVGLTMGYSAVLLPQLELERNGTFVTSTDQQTFIASLGALPMALGTIIGGFLIEYAGRRKTHVLTCIPSTVGWLAIFISPDLSLLLCGRFLTGLTSGILSAATGIYFGEIADPKHRGFFIGATSLSVSLGIFCSHLAVTLLSWRMSALIFSSLPIISWMLMGTTPESPHWLANKNENTQAERSFYFLRGKTAETILEFENISKKKEAESAAIFSRRFFSPVLLVCVLMTSGQWTGHNAVTFYSISIVKSTIQDGRLDEYLATLLVDLTRIVTSIIGCILLKTVARRKVGVYGNVGAVLSLAVLSLHSYFLQARYPLVPLLSLLSFVSFASSCVVPLPWTLLVELLPSPSKGAAGALCSCVAFLAAFSVVQSAPYIFAGVGPGGAFLIFSGSAMVGAICVFLFLPETKDKTLQEIEDNLGKD